MLSLWMVGGETWCWGRDREPSQRGSLLTGTREPSPLLGVPEICTLLPAVALCQSGGMTLRMQCASVARLCPFTAEPWASAMEKWAVSVVSLALLTQRRSAWPGLVWTSSGHTGGGNSRWQKGSIWTNQGRATGWEPRGGKVVRGSCCSYVCSGREGETHLNVSVFMFNWTV